MMEPQGGGRRRQNVVAAVMSQGLVAAASLVLQLLALWRLGTAGLGAFAILNAGWLVVITAAHTGWVGDPLTVLDRHEPDVRRALTRAVVIGEVGSFAVGTLGAWLTTGIGIGSAALFGVAMALWVAEETGRRLLMACFRFTALVVNDLIYGVVAVGLALALAMADRLTLTWLIVAMLAGAAASTIVALMQIPRDELSIVGPGRADWSTLRGFSLWRSGQLGMRPATMLLLRVGIGAVSGYSAVGLFEAGRILIAPALTASNGIGSFTLPEFTRQRDAGQLTKRSIATASMQSAMLAAALLPTALLVGLVVSRSDATSLPTSLVVSWCVFALANGANIPVVNALSVLGRSALLFAGRCLDLVVSLGIGLALVAIGGVEFVPLALVAGMLGGTGWALVRHYGKWGERGDPGEPAERGEQTLVPAGLASAVGEEPAPGHAGGVGVSDDSLVKTAESGGGGDR